MNQFLRDRILRKLDPIPDERLYQVLDYVEFLESKYAERQNPSANVFQRFAETVEDKLRAGRVSAATISETMGLMNKAMGVLSGVAAAGKSVASDIASAASSLTTTTAGDRRRRTGASAAAATGDASTITTSRGGAVSRSRDQRGSAQCARTARQRAGIAAGRGRAGRAAAHRRQAHRDGHDPSAAELPTLLGGLLIRPRVAGVDKLLVAAAIAYILMPVDLIPDFIPFLGEVDDVFLLVTRCSG